MKILSGKNVGIYLVFGIVIAILYGHILGSYWLFDDLQILRHAEKYKPWEYFFIPEVWQELSIANLTPLVTLSFDGDFTAFGFAPKWFYLHHLISLWFVSIMLYFVLKLWVPRFFAVFGVLLFLLSAPVGLASEFLMIRHYIEGSALILLSFFMFVVALRRSSFKLACAAALPYFLAMSAKEIYVPMAIITLFLPEKKWVFRFKYATPLLGTLLIYFVWRSRMLVRTMGGYQDKFFGADIFSEIYRIAVRNPMESVKMFSGLPSFGSHWQVVTLVLVGIFLFVSILYCVRNRKLSILLFYAVLLVFVYAPLAPIFIIFSVGEFASYRLIYFVSLIYSSMVALMAYTFYQTGKDIAKLHPIISRRMPQWTTFFSCMIILALISWSSHQWLGTQNRLFIRPLVAEGKFLMDGDDRNLMVKTFTFPINNYYENLDYFKMLYGKRSIPGVVYSTYAYFDNKTPSQLEGIHIFKYSSDHDSMVDITQDFLKRRVEYLSHIRKLPFEVRLRVKKAGLNFSLGPLDSGRYFVLVGYRPGLYCATTDLPRNLPRNVYSGHVKWYLRFGWESPDGGITLSPEWFFDLSKNQELFWRQ